MRSICVHPYRASFSRSTPSPTYRQVPSLYCLQVMCVAVAAFTRSLVGLAEQDQTLKPFPMASLLLMLQPRLILPLSPLQSPT